MKSARLLLWCVCSMCIVSLAHAQPVLTSFPTGGKPIYHLRPASIDDSGKRVIVSAAMDGMVLCHTYEGKLLWKSQTGGFFPFDLAVGDGDGDGFDEAFVASADGGLYAFDHDGKNMWQFKTDAPLYQVCLARTESGEMRILAGGIEKVLYCLSPAGEVLRTVSTDVLIRGIRAGRFRGSKGQQIALINARNGRDQFFLNLLDPETLEPLWNAPIALTETRRDFPNLRIFSVVPMDLDGDGAEEIVMSLASGTSADIGAYNGNGELVPMQRTDATRRQLYRMNLLAPVNTGALGERGIIGLHGLDLEVYNLDGSLRSLHRDIQPYSNIAFDAETATCLFGSNISGDDGITLVRIDQENWQEAMLNAPPATGKLSQVMRNHALLAKQAQQFKAPSYQPSPRHVMAVVQQTPEEVETRFKTGRPHDNVQYVSYFTFHEKPDDMGAYRKRHGESSYRGKASFQTREEILADARKMEAAGQDFFIQAGHGRPYGMDYYISLETIAELLKIAPETLQGFVFAENEPRNEAMKRAVETELQPMAGLCREYGGKKILLRNQNIFWNGVCYLDVWNDTLLQGKYPDIFTPSMEETACRTQEMSLSGRVGLWMTGHFTQHSARVVHDNATFSRCWEYGRQNFVSHFFRALALQSSLGADIFHINTGPEGHEQLLPLFDLLERGAILVPQREEIVSISSLCLGMTEPSERFIFHGTNAHNASVYEPNQPPLVFERMDSFWAGAPIPEHCFSNYGFGCRSRSLNFLPTLPYGLVTMIPDNTDLSRYPMFKNKITTNGEFWFDAEGKQHDAVEYKPVVEQALKEAAAQLPVRVEGDAAWSAVRVSPRHIRVLLLDSGYIDPADRDASIIPQTIKAIGCRDILSGEKIHLKDGKFSLRVPMGSLRICDIEHELPSQRMRFL
jgi:lambda-carrageenase